MELMFIFLVSISLCLLLKAFINLLLPSPSPPLPPGPLRIPFIGSFILIGKSLLQLEPILRTLHSKYGPIVTLHIGPRPTIFIADRSLAHQAFVQNGAVFSDRPEHVPIANRLIDINLHTIRSSFYGPTWRLFRRNLTTEMLHPTRIKSFSGQRSWVLDILLDRLRVNLESGKSIVVIDHLRYTMFCLVVFMCFGDRLDGKKIMDIQYVLHRFLVDFYKFNVLNFWPSVTRVLFKKRWEEFMQLLKDRENLIVPLIRARKKDKEEKLRKSTGGNIVCYVDTLLDLELPEEKRKLEESEMVSLCSEFLDAGTDSTTATLQWIMANLVKYPHIQQRIFEEVREVVGEREDKEVKQEDLNRLPYLKAVVLEVLRRHPPTHFPLSHAASEDVVLNGYLVPKKGTVSFALAEMGWDPTVWEDPMEFKPERFLNNGEWNINGMEWNNGNEMFDVKGSKEIKMMPFGLGRRMCPASNLAMLHLEYFVANLILNFEWKPATDAPVDLTETQEFLVVMKNPLQVQISPRI